MTAAPYLLAAVLGFLLTMVPSPKDNRLVRTEKLAWKISCGLLLILGALRPYEIHSQITQTLRSSALMGGWYNERAAQQTDLLYVVAFFMAVLAAFILFETRRWHLSTRAGLFAFLYLTGLLIINILSLHGLDALLGRSLGGIPLRWMLDLAGLGAFVGSAFWFRQWLVKTYTR